MLPSQLILKCQCGAVQVLMATRELRECSDLTAFSAGVLQLMYSFSCVPLKDCCQSLAPGCFFLCNLVQFIIIACGVFYELQCTGQFQIDLRAATLASISALLIPLSVSLYDLSWIHQI